MKISKSNAVLIWKQSKMFLCLGWALLSRSAPSIHIFCGIAARRPAAAALFHTFWLRAATACLPVVRLAVRRLVGQGGAAPGRTHKAGHVRRGPAAREIRAVRPIEARTARRGCPHGQPRGDGFPANEGAAGGHSYARTQRVLLLFAAAHGPGALPRSCRAAGPEGRQFLPQPGFLLRRMQLTRKGKPGQRVVLRLLYRDGRLTASETHWGGCTRSKRLRRQAPARTGQRRTQGPEHHAPSR